MTDTAAKAAGHVRLNREHSRIPFLDGLRGWMALWVIAAHALGNIGGQFPVTFQPMMAVEVFMILSGFLMAYYFRIRGDHEPWRSPRTWLAFYVRRFFRIAPVYYLILIPVFVFRTPLHISAYDTITGFRPGPVYFSRLPAPFQIRDFLYHLTFTFGFFRTFLDSTLLPDWSLAMEMQFYFVLPFVMLLCRRAGHIFTTLLLMGAWVACNRLVAAGTPHAGYHYLVTGFRMPTLLPFKINCFAAGILLAESLYFQGQCRWRSLLLCCAALIISCTASGLAVFFIAGLIAVLLLYRGETPVIRAPLEAVRRFLSGRLSDFLAVTSYSVYLCHILTVWVLGGWLAHQPSFVRLGIPARFSIFFAAVLVISYPSAFLIHKIIEQPGIILGRRIVRGLRPVPPPAVVSSH